VPRTWVGSYLDGRTPTRQRVDVRATGDALYLTMESGATIRWPHAEIRQTQGRNRGEQVRLERGRDDRTEALIVDEPGFLEELSAISPGQRVGTAARGPRRLFQLLGVGACALAGLAAIYWWGIPALARVVAARVPVSWEEKLGRGMMESIASEGRRCADPERQARIDEITKTLVEGLGPTPYTFRVTIVDNRVVNAFAAPGGYIAVFRGLLDQTDTAEELAGTLAHEIQHVVHRHSTRALVQYASLGILLSALTGDPTGAAALGAQGAFLLGQLRYSRLAEEEADRDGIRLLQAAGLDPSGEIHFFEKLAAKGQGQSGRHAEYLSTHPLPATRVAALRELVREGPKPTRVLLEGYDWKDIRKICPEPGRP
jgi:Zn-dependent protease with chaperone function